MNCKWNGRGLPRTVPQRHDEDCAGTDECPGCLPCPELHCVVCGRQHAVGACAECVTATRDDLRTIATLCGALPAEAAHRGVNGEAMMLIGPTSDPEAWRNRAMSAMRGRIDAAYLEDCRDEAHPLWVLGTWEQVWRDRLDQPTDLTATLPRLVDYLDRHMHEMAEEPEVPFDDFARDLRGCRGHLEDVLRDGEQVEPGAPCVQCERPMMRVVTDQGAQDAYRCSGCRRTVTGDQYRYAVGVAYLAHADRLTATDMHRQYDVRPGSVTGWATKGEVRKRGKDANGRQLYDVDDVLTKVRETRPEVETA